MTHIIFKGGKQTTLNFYRRSLLAAAALTEEDEEEAEMDDSIGNTSIDSTESTTSSKPQKAPVALVGIGWVIRCREEKVKVGEEEYLVDLADQTVFAKVRFLTRRPLLAAQILLLTQHALRAFLPAAPQVDATQAHARHDGPSSPSPSSTYPIARGLPAVCRAGQASKHAVCS